MLDDVETVAYCARRVIGMAENHQARLVGLVGGELIGAGKSAIILREPGEIGFGLEPGPHCLADVGIGRVRSELQTRSGMEEPWNIVRILALEAQRLGHVIERKD